MEEKKKKIRKRSPDKIPGVDDVAKDMIKTTCQDLDLGQRELTQMTKTVFAHIRKDKRLTPSERVTLIALFLNKGMVTMACNQAKISYGTHNYRMRTNPIYREYVEEVNEYVMDLLEAVLIDKAANGNLEAIKMVMQAKGSNRGYAKETSTTNIMGPTQFNVSFVKPGELGPSDGQVDLPGPPEFTEFTEES